MGAFIVFEGGEGAGKSTQARILSRRISIAGYPTLLIREPGGTDIGEAVRRWLKSRPGLTPLTELFLFSAARAQLVEKVIRPALSSNQNVICARFTASTVAYQGYGRGLDPEAISRLSETATGGLRPNLTIFLDIPVEAGLARKRKSERDVFERETIEFHQRVREGYMAAASREPETSLVLDGTLTRNILTERIWARVQPLLV